MVRCVVAQLSLRRDGGDIGCHQLYPLFVMDHRFVVNTLLSMAKSSGASVEERLSSLGFGFLEG